MMEEKVSVRTIREEDNAAVAVIIRAALKEFGVDKPGTVYYDETTDALAQLFQTPGSVYFVLVEGARIIGGGGIFPSPGLPPGTCELVKMYLAAGVRGKGYGRLLIDKSIEWAREAGYRQVYLETMPELKQALKVYEKFGFKYLTGPMGNTGHFGCDVWMLKTL